MSEPLNGTGIRTPSAHAIGRLVAQWVLPVLAVAVLVMILRETVMQIRTLSGLSECAFSLNDSASSCWKGPSLNNLTLDQQLILKGDCTRTTAVERQKAIWEKWPTNIVYLHNYVTYLAEDVHIAERNNKTNTERRASFAREIERLQSLDPDNARLDYILAGNLLAQAIKDQNSQTNADGTVTNKWSMHVLDRTKLEQAMAHIKTGLGKPEFRRYTSEMTSERLAIMGEPITLLEQVAEIGMLAGVLLPDLAMCRKLARASMAYALLLIDEGRAKEAGEFISAFRRFVPQVNNDAFTLIDVLAVGAVVGIAAEQVPATYNRLGDAVMEQQAAIETAALAQPVKDWKKKTQEAMDDPVTESTLRRHGGILARLLLSALPVHPTATELAPSRLLDYVIVERVGLSVLSICLVVLMVCCVFVALYYHCVSHTSPRLGFLLPHSGECGRLLLWGVLLPVLCYYGVTRWGPWSSRSLSALVGVPQFMAQCIALFLVILTVTFTFTGQWVRRACHDLSLPDPPQVHLRWRVWMRILVGVTVLVAVLPESWLTAADMWWPLWALAITVKALVLLGLACVVYGVVRLRWFRRTYAAYYGSLARTLIPSIAVVVIVLNLVAQPYLSREERHLIAIDTVMHIDPRGCFTAIESRLVQRLKAEMQQAASGTPPSSSD